MEICHIGNENSGRYPRGSGDRPFQRMPSWRRKKLIKTVNKAIISKTKEIDKANASHVNKKPISDEQKNLKEIRNRKTTRRNIRHLSDEEIRRTISRLRDEKTLKELIDSDISPGRKAISEILSSAGQTVGKEVATGSMRYVLRQSMKSEKMELSGLADAIWPKKEKKKNDND